MYRQDIAEENGEIEPYLIDDVIDIVCEWNYELILDAEAHRNDPKDFNDYSEFQSKYDSLKADEKSWTGCLIKPVMEGIDRNGSCFGGIVIAHLGKNDLEKAAVTVAEGIKRL